MCNAFQKVFCGFDKVLDDFLTAGYFKISRLTTFVDDCVQLGLSEKLSKI